MLLGIPFMCAGVVRMQQKPHQRFRAASGDMRFCNIANATRTHTGTRKGTIGHNDPEEIHSLSRPPFLDSVVGRMKRHNSYFPSITDARRML